MISCIESGWVQGEIQNSAYKQQMDIENHEQNYCRG